MADKPKSYVTLRAPGQKCLRCGCDLAHRAPGTKWCSDCAGALNKARLRAHKILTDKLIARDTVVAPIAPVFYADDMPILPCYSRCAVCKHILYMAGNFCVHCGQRLKED